MHNISQSCRRRTCSARAKASASAAGSGTFAPVPRRPLEKAEVDDEASDVSVGENFVALPHTALAEIASAHMVVPLPFN
eukprot:2376016-Pleurochrysis_carterae.AAC.2